MSKIFVRERRRIEREERKPRFRIVAIAGTDVRFRAKHVRRIELDAIAEAVGAEVVLLPAGGDGSGDAEGGGTGAGRGGEGGGRGGGRGGRGGRHR